MAFDHYTATAAARLSQVLVREGYLGVSRESVTILAGSGAKRELKLGTVIGTVTASSKVVALNPGGADGSEAVSGIMSMDGDAADGTDGTGQAIVRQAVVAEGGLIWPAGITAPQKETAIAELKALDIHIVSSV